MTMSQIQDVIGLLERGIGSLNAIQTYDLDGVDANRLATGRYEVSTAINQLRRLHTLMVAESAAVAVAAD